MQAEIITIGDELLIGQTVDTNSAWIATALNGVGVNVRRITSIADKTDRIIKALDEVENESEWVFLTGGLGPTKDDITKSTLAAYFGCKLIMYDQIRNKIEEYFKSRNIEVLDVNRNQALLPDKARILENTRGTASGMLFKKNGKTFVSLPGVPFEMKGLMTDYILPELSELQDSVIRHKTIMTIGIGESSLANMVIDWEDSLEKENISIAYLPSLKNVKVRLSKNGKNVDEIEESLKRKTDEFVEIAGKFVFGFDDEPLEVVLGRLLRNKKLTLACAESCTGGNIARTLTSVAGSSDYFLGSAVTYATESKTELLGVPAEVIGKFGVVSEEVARSMARGCRERFNSDFGLSTTGFAGPDENNPEVGKVCIGLSTSKGEKSITLKMGKSRKSNIERFTFEALNFLRKEILSEV